MTIEQKYIERHPNSARLYERARKVLPSGVTHDSRYMTPFPIYAERAAGAHKWDADGHEIIDFVMGHGALMLGHNFPSVIEAAQAQLALGTHLGASTLKEIEWAEEVTKIVPSAEVVRFTSSGTEATLMALRLARTYTGKPGVIKFDRHFHGWHDYVVGNSKYSTGAPAGVPQATLDSVSVVQLDMNEVRQTVSDRSDVGAIIVESAGASSGQLPVPRGFLAELQAFCRREGIVFIMDEVVTGFRWAPGGVQEVEGLKPDLTTLAKILAGGFPGGAVAGRREVMEHLQFGNKGAKIGHPGTFNANPLSAAAGTAALREIADGTHQKRANELSAQLRSGMNGVMCELGLPGFVYGQASEFRIVVAGTQVPEAQDYDPRDLPWSLLEQGMKGETARMLQLAMTNHGAHLFGAGGLVSSVHSEDDIARTVEAWRNSLVEMRAEQFV